MPGVWLYRGRTFVWDFDVHLAQEFFGERCYHTNIVIKWHFFPECPDVHDTVMGQLSGSLCSVWSFLFSIKSCCSLYTHTIVFYTQPLLSVLV